MNIKFMLKIIAPYESFPLEVYLPPDSIPADSALNADFLESLLNHELIEEISDYCCEEFSNYYDIFETVRFAPKGRYWLSEAYDTYTELALEEARKFAQRYRMIYTFSYDDTGQELYRADFNLQSYQENVVDSRETDCQSHLDVGSAIIHGMEQYMTDGSWHYDLIPEGQNKKPIMWFGLANETPKEGWILNLEPDSENEKDWKDFWFCKDADEDWCNRVPDADEAFLIWNVTECASFLSPLSKVLATCPIEVSEKDDYDSLTCKINLLIRDRKGKEF